MVAATRMIKKEDVIKCATKKKQRGRPTVLDDPQYLLQAAQAKWSYRQTVNVHYAVTGAALVAIKIGDDEQDRIFNDGKGNFKYQGVLEQIGRYHYDDDFTDDDVSEVIKIALDEINKGEKSKDIEKALRKMKIIVKKERVRE